MDETELKELLERFKQGSLSSSKLISKLKSLPYENLQFARLDYHRKLRVGIPEVIFCEGKSEKQILDIVSSMVKHKHPVFATRLDNAVASKLKKKYPGGNYNQLARTFTLQAGVKKKNKSAYEVALITAGTSDIPVAEEARETLDFLDIAVEPIYDVGVAGLHRFLGEEEKLSQAKVLIVVAGMEGALASVVGGLSSRPVIAVPTSVGYGTSFNGLSPLLAMLNACSSGISVVNIDNGYGAACAAHRIINAMRENK